MMDETPPNGKNSAGQDFAELRGLLVGPEQVQLRALRERLDDPARFAEAVSKVLAEAVRLRSRRDGKLRHALDPIIADAISISVRRNPAILADALFPAIGSAVRRAVASALQSMVESLNQLVEQSWSLRALKWRLEAWRTGKSFAEIVLLRSLLYRVEQVFLIHRKTGLLLLCRKVDDQTIGDADLVSGMLTAVQDFVSDSFGAQPGQELEIMQVGRLSVWIQHAPQAILACLVRGTAPKALRLVFQEALERICSEQSAALEDFDGDATRFEASARHLDACLLGQRPGTETRRRRLLVWTITAAAVMTAMAWIGTWYYQYQNWNRYVSRLTAEPGIVVTAAGKKGGRYYVSGLRDSLAANPVTLLAGSGIDGAKVRFHWEPYLSLQPKFTAVRERERAKTVIERTTVLFGTDKAELTGEQMKTIINISLEMRALFAAGGNSVRIEIVGHSDDTGKEERNAELSQTRAGRVAAALIETGIPADRLTIRAAGTSEPVRRGEADVDKELNRSVSFRAFMGSK